MWEEYRNFVDNGLTNSNIKMTLRDTNGLKMDLVWATIKEIINTASSKCIPRKKRAKQNRSNKSRNRLIPQFYIYHLKCLRSFYRKAKQELGLQCKNEIRVKWNTKIKKINQAHKNIKIPDIPQTWTSSWMDVCMDQIRSRSKKY